LALALRAGLTFIVGVHFLLYFVAGHNHNNPLLRALSRLFISHSSRNDDWALALQAWLIREGWGGENDIFLDLDPERGIVAGQRWAQALEDAATRCEAVLFLVSEVWLASKWCGDEYQLANRLNKKLFALLIDDIPLDRLPGGLTAQWQVVHLKGEPAERFLTVHPRTQHQSPVHIAEAALKSLKRGLAKAGIGPETFDLAPDAAGPYGWRAPYRGLEALEPEDAAVFFGRSADIVRGIDALRGLAARKPPRLLVVLGASGAGKSSFLRAGLWPRLARDDSQWLPLRVIRAGRGGAIEGSEGLLYALEDVHRRFALRASRADLRQRLATPESFLELLQELRRVAARRALISGPPYPLPLLCLDQGEELFAADAGSENERLLRLARAAIDADAALMLITIRSDAYGFMQNAGTLAGIDQVPLSLGPVPHGEIARIIREPSEVLRRKAGPSAPIFDAAIVVRLQNEIAGEMDALPLLAFVLQRLMREHSGTNTIGVRELKQTGGVAAAIEQEAEAALADAGFGPDREERREVLRRLFIPRLARIDRESDSKAPQRRVALQSNLPADMLGLVRALTERRLLVTKLADVGGADGDAVSIETGAATLEVAHEALLRRWPTLADLLREDRDALLLLDGVLSAATDWDKADATRKPDFLAHRGSRLSDAQGLATRGDDWAREIASAQAYLAACAKREATERSEKEEGLAREQARVAAIAAAQARTAALQQRAKWMLGAFATVVVLGFGAGIWQYQTNLARKEQLDRAEVRLVPAVATSQRLSGKLDSALRLSVYATEREIGLDQRAVTNSLAYSVLVDAVAQSDWRLALGGHQDSVNFAAFSPDTSRIVTITGDRTARIWDATSGQAMQILRQPQAGNAGQIEKPGDWSFVSAGFSGDGKQIVIASSDMMAHLDVRTWNVMTGMENGSYHLSGSAFRFAAVSPDGRRIVTASQENTARVWDAASGQQIVVLRGHEARVQSPNFSADGSRIVTVSEDNTARVWHAESGQQIVVLRGHEARVQSADFSADGSRIVTASQDNTARVWHAESGQQIVVLRGHQDEVRSASFSPNGLRIVTASADKTARIWDGLTGREIAVLRGHEAHVQSAAFSPDGLRIVTASGDKSARTWDVGNTTKTAVLRGHEARVQSAAFSADGSRVVTASRDRTVRIWDAASGREVAVLRGHQDTVAALSPDGSRIVTILFDRSADETNISEWARVYLDPRGNTARLWDVASGKEIAALKPEYADRMMAQLNRNNVVASAAFSPDGSRIVTASGDKTARIWDAASAKEIAVLRGHDIAVYSAAFSPDGSRIVTASEDKTARIWDVQLETMPPKDLLTQACALLAGLTKVTRDEMRLAGYPDSVPEIDVCTDTPAAP
jgi:WD40 repeat protein